MNEPQAEPRGYPQRDSHFAHRFTRLLTKTAAAQEIGPEGTWMLTVIVHQEDAKRYKGAVTFYNTQLMPLCGIGSDRRLFQVRDRLVEAGWLHYEAGAKRRPGKYWVLVPDDLSDASDAPVDERHEFFSCESQEKAKRNRRESEEKAKTNRREGARPSTLDPNPAPNPEERGSPALDGAHSGIDEKVQFGFGSHKMHRFLGEAPHGSECEATGCDFSRPMARGNRANGRVPLLPRGE